MRGVASLFTQTVSVETFQGSGQSGAVFASPVTKKCFVNDVRDEIRASDGAEITASTTLYAALADIAAFTVGSRVNVNGHKAIVLKAYRRDAGPAFAHHTQVDLT